MKWVPATPDASRRVPSIWRPTIAIVFAITATPACSGLATMPFAGMVNGDAGATGGSPVRYTLLDDMEGPSDEIAWTSPAGTMPGFWNSFADVQCGDVSPIPVWDTADSGAWTFSSVPTPYQTFPGIVSTHAARLRTTAPLLNTWGAGMAFDFAQHPPGEVGSAISENRPCTMQSLHDLQVPVVPVDLSAYRGLTFWAMASRQGTTRLLLQLQDRSTMPEGALCPDATGAVANHCYNGFGVYLELTDSFTQYTVDFSILAQNPSWGYHPAPDVLDLEHIYQLGVLVETPGGQACDQAGDFICADPSWTAALTFDVWIDDLYLIQK